MNAAYWENTFPDPSGSGENKKGETVIGSGFSYDEDELPTDEPIPIEKAKLEDIVELPDLGKPNRP
jgi:hypothetical protein